MTDRSVRLFEVAPRDGLQNEKQLVSTADKIRLVDELAAAGFSRVEVTSFVSARLVPQMADAAEVLGRIKRPAGVSFAALTPNLKGYEAARAAGASEVAIFASASEAFSKANINCTIEESFERFAPILERAAQDRIPVRGYVSCVVDCPYSGPVAPADAARVAARLFSLGVYEVSLGDTIGTGTPETIRPMLEAALSAIPAERLAGHFHDTNGRALDNAEVALAMGLRSFDSSAGGLGGCPFAPGAKGNVDTVALEARCRGLGFETGIDVARLAETARFARSLRSPA